MENPLKTSLPTASNENTGLIKVIAFVFMVVDHVGAAFFPRCLELRLLGRIAFPLYAWCLVVGACYTHSILRYGLRLLGVGLFSQFPYVYALGGGWLELNIFATLLTGLLGVAAIRARRFGSAIWGPILALLVSCVVNMDYGWRGVALILLLYAARNSRPGLAAVMVAFCLFWGADSIPVVSLFGMQLPNALPLVRNLLSPLKRAQFWAILALPFMLIPMYGEVKLPKRVVYTLYPNHLLIIAFIRFVM